MYLKLVLYSTVLYSAVVKPSTVRKLLVRGSFTLSFVTKDGELRRNYGHPFLGVLLTASTPVAFVLGDAEFIFLLAFKYMDKASAEGRRRQKCGGENMVQWVDKADRLV